MSKKSEGRGRLYITKLNLTIYILPTVVDVGSGHEFGDHQSQAALRAASTWMGDRLAEH